MNWANFKQKQNYNCYKRETPCPTQKYLEPPVDDNNPAIRCNNDCDDGESAFFAVEQLDSDCADFLFGSRENIEQQSHYALVVVGRRPVSSMKKRGGGIGAGEES